MGTRIFLTRLVGYPSVKKYFKTVPRNAYQACGMSLARFGTNPITQSHTGQPMSISEFTIRESAEAILHSEKSVGEIFYSIMFTKYPEIASHFEDVDMTEQAAVVTLALCDIEQYYTMPSPAMRRYLQVLGSRHRRKKIPKRLFADWQEALLSTLENFHGSQWNESVAEQWQHAIENATRAMFEGYEKNERFD